MKPAGDEVDGLASALTQLTRSAPETVAAGTGAAARLLAPLSGSIVGSSRPLLRWTGATVAVVQLCADRGCTRPLASFFAARQSARPPVPIRSGVVFWRLLSLGRGSAGLTIVTTPAWELFVPAGAGSVPAANRGLRYDADADGFVDAAVRAQNGSAGTDELRVFRGGPSGLEAGRATTLVLDTTHFGVGLSAAGDVNGDGFADLVVADGRGVVVYSGSAGGPVAAPLCVIPPPADAYVFGFGFQLAGAGDVNGDGYGDLMVGDGSLEAWVFLGGPSGPASAPAWVLDRRGVIDRFIRLVTTGDLNGDGFGDLVLGDYGPDGTPQGFRFFRGGAGGLEAPSAGTFIERPSFVSGAAGDVTGDGISDLVTVEGATLALFAGGPAFPTATPTQVVLPADAASPAVQIGDFDGDGAFDVAAITSTPTSSFYFTDDRIDLYPGGPGGLAPAPTQTLRESDLLPDNQLNFGGSLGNGDFNRDGREDLLAGASPPYPTPFFDTSPSAVLVFPGAPGGVSPSPAPRFDGTPGFGLRVTAGAPQSGP